MSSNLRIKKVCQFCYSEFIAKTTVTKYCSLKCAQRAYKHRVKEKKLEKLAEQSRVLNIQTNQSKNARKKRSRKRDFKQENDKKLVGEIMGENTNDVIDFDYDFTGENTNDVLTVYEAAQYLKVSEKTIYSLIENNKIKFYNINKRLTRINKESLDKLITFDLKNSERGEQFNIEHSYTISEIHKNFKVSPTLVYHKLKEYNVPKKKVGKETLVPKNLVDLIFESHLS